jgi:hypothetical protein
MSSMKMRTKFGLSAAFKAEQNSNKDKSRSFFIRVSIDPTLAEHDAKAKPLFIINYAAFHYCQRFAFSPFLPILSLGLGLEESMD